VEDFTTVARGNGSQPRNLRKEFSSLVGGEAHPQQEAHPQRRGKTLTPPPNANPAFGGKLRLSAGFRQLRIGVYPQMPNLHWGAK